MNRTLDRAGDDLRRTMKARRKLDLLEMSSGMFIICPTIDVLQRPGASGFADDSAKPGFLQ